MQSEHLAQSQEENPGDLEEQAGRRHWVAKLRVESVLGQHRGRLYLCGLSPWHLQLISPYLKTNLISKGSLLTTPFLCCLSRC